MTDERLTEDELNTVLHAARSTQPMPSPDWMTAVVADAVRLVDQRRRPFVPSLWEQIMGAVGGRAGLGGLVAASAVGLWLGLAPPAMIGDPVGTALGGAPLVDLIGGASFDYAILLDEG